jgi:hypothetical protein
MIFIFLYILMKISDVKVYILIKLTLMERG